MRSTTILPMALTTAMVALATPAAAQVAEVRPRGAAPTVVTVQGRPQLNGFSVVLVEGATSGGTATEGVPAAAAKALADLKDFLPYKSYRLLDTQWTLGSGRMSNRLRGPDGRDYHVSLLAQISPFALRTTDHGVTRAYEIEGRGRISVSSFTLSDATGKSVAQLADESRRASLWEKGWLPAAAAAADDPLINTSFSMNVGETVVVGTSRLQGDKALIVLLTAVGK